MNLIGAYGVNMLAICTQKAYKRGYKDMLINPENRAVAIPENHTVMLINNNLA